MPPSHPKTSRRHFFACAAEAILTPIKLAFRRRGADLTKINELKSLLAKLANVSHPSILEPAMSLKTISFIFMQEAEAPGAAACAYVLGLAEAAGAHLNVGIGVSPVIVPIDTPAAELMIFVEEENKQRKEAARRAALKLEADAAARGVAASHEIDGDAYDPIFPKLIRFARASDLCVTPAPRDNEPIAHDLAIELLMASGVPLLVVPPAWPGGRPIINAIVAWDGGAPCARAVRDASPLLRMADNVEIVSIHGEKDLPGDVAGADIAAHLARHCKRVVASQVPAQDKNVAQTLRQHAHLVRADLIVMGGYGHSRLRELVLGGVTRDMLKHIEIPTLLSH